MSNKQGKRNLGLSALAAAVAAASNPALADTFTVENLNATGEGSLGEAISLANENGGLDTIKFGVTGTINLGEASLPTIDDAVNIQGPGAGALRIVAGTSEDAVFRVRMDFNEYNASISGLTITGARYGAIEAYYDEGPELFLRNIVLSGNGTADEPAFQPALIVRSDADVTLSNSQVRDNFTYSEGAIGVFDSAFLEVQDSTISGNESFGFASAMVVGGAGVALVDSEVRNNSVEDGSFGAISVGGGFFVSDGSSFTGNSSEFGRGGAIAFKYSEGILVDSTFSGNTAKDGGAIYSEGTFLQMASSDFRSNRAVSYGESSSEGGAIHAWNSVIGVDASFKYLEGAGSTTFSGNSADIGGALALNRTLFVGKYSQVTSNRATIAGGAIATSGSKYGPPAGVVLSGSVISGNTVSGADAFGGGAIAAYGNDVFYAENSIIRNNSTTGVGGGLYVENVEDVVMFGSKITGNTAGETGGAIFAYGGDQVAMKYTDVSGNTSSEGSAVDVSSQDVMRFKYSTLANNRSVDGPAITMETYSGDVFVIGSTLSGNVGTGAPAVQVQGEGEYANLILQNSTLSGNRGNAYPVAMQVAGMYYSDIQHASFVNNVGGLGLAQLHMAGDDTTSDPVEGSPTYAEIVDSVFTSNMDYEVVVGGTDPTAENGYGLDEEIDVTLGANIMEQGYTVAVVEGEGTVSGPAPLEEDPKLGILADNGGFTKTHAPTADSPVIDAGDGGRPFGRDQRGVDVQNGTSDLGAVEFTDNRPPRLLASIANRLAGVVGREIPPFFVADAFTDPDGDGIVVEGVTGLPTGLDYDDDLGVISGELEQAGTYQVVVFVRDDADPSLSTIEQFTVRVLETAPVADDDDDDDFLGSSSMAFFGLMAAMGWLRRRKRS